MNKRTMKVSTRLTLGFGTAVSPVTGHIFTASYGLGVISEFAPNGTPISPPGGYAQGNLSKPQGIAFDQKGNLWIPNFGNGTVTIYLGANPAKSINVAGTAASHHTGTVPSAAMRSSVSPTSENIAAPVMKKGNSAMSTM